MNPRGSVGSTALLVDFPDLLGELKIRKGPPALSATDPCVEAAPGDAQNLAHQAYFESLPVVPDEPEPQLVSFAK